VRSFGVMVAAGFLLAVWIWGKLLAKYGDDPAEDPARGSQVGVWVLVGMLVGARLLYVAVETTRYLSADKTPAMERYLASEDGAHVDAELFRDHPDEIERARPLRVGWSFLHHHWEILFVWKGGLVMYGGAFGACLAGLWACKRNGLNPLNSLDTGLVAGFFGLAVGRWGCFLVGDDHGSVVPERFRELPFPVTLTVPSRGWLQSHPESLFPHELAGEVLWATQIWMSVNAILVALVAWTVLRHRRWYGQVSALLLVHYSVTRFVIEGFRGDTVRGLWFDGAISTSQLIAIPGALAGLVWFLRGTLRARAARAG
jgi:prolipoprotein diacylglyceryl transferase